MISGQKCLPEAELVAGKFGNPTLATMYNVHYARMKLIQLSSTDIVNQFIHTEVLSYCYIKFKVVNSETS